MNLTLPLKKEYFDAIKQGVKTLEYRSKTEFWGKRIEGKDFDKVVLTCGYPSKDDTSRRIERPWKGYRIVSHPILGETYEIKVN